MDAPAPNGAPRRQPTAGVVVVGNEVLSGKVTEENAAFFVKRLRALGVRLREIAFVEDDVDAIARAVRRLAGENTWVFTSGGIGPTHDDVTIEAVARAFDREVGEHEALLAHLDRALAGRPPGAWRRLTRAPVGAELVETTGKPPWPVLKVENVFVFPGVPWLLRSKFDAIAGRFASDARLVGAHFVLEADEAVICEALDGIAARFTTVEIGSYPAFDGRVWSLKLTLESLDAAALAAAADEVRAAFAAWIRSASDIAPVSGDGD
ncbi:MAG: competence/damage-inducible protein A [Deltaproteobacteria bacterium]|nr:competence/damage-inducible protein A [Deltaproteobacteria bacterium]